MAPGRMPRASETKGRSSLTQPAGDPHPAHPWPVAPARSAVVRGLALDPRRLAGLEPRLTGWLPVFQVPILIPCHRVVCSSGAMGNYTGGLATKEWLLAHEGRLAGKPTYPGGSYLAGTRRGALGGTPSPHPAGRDRCMRE